MRTTTLCNHACALALALVALGACGKERPRAPFLAPEVPATYEPPPAPAVDAGAAPDDAEPHLVTHLYGDGAYPCQGHPACDEPSPADQTLGASVGGVEFLDPNLITEVEGSFVAVNLFEGLIMPPRRSGLPFEAGVAERYRLEDDGRTYTFFLRDDARWSDGRPVTAHDFVYSWRRKLAPATASVSVEPLYWLEGAEDFNKGVVDDPAKIGVEALDDHTLRVRLKHPTPLWLNYVCTHSYRPVPRWAIEAHGRRWTRPEHIVTNGPYHLTEHAQRDRIVLDKSDTYWDRHNVRIPRVVLHHSDSESQDQTRYRTGQIQWARQGVLPTDIPELMSAGRPDFFIDPLLCYYMYVFRVDRPPFDDVRVRRAFDMAIDKRRLTTHVTRGQEIPADGPVQPHFAATLGYQAPAGDPYDPEAARELLAQAGFPGGAGFPEVTLIYNTLERHKLIAEFTQRSVAENLGVTVKLENMEFKSLLKRVRTGDFSISRRGWCGVDHPYSMLEIWRSDSPRNASGWSSEAFDEALRASTLAPTREAQLAKLAEAERVLQREAPLAPLFYYTNPYLRKPVLRGHEPELTDTHPVKYMWWGDTQRPPRAHALIADTPETRAAAAAADDDARERLTHIHGPAKSWPCEGHPACDELPPDSGLLGVDITSAEFIDPNMVSDTEGTLVALNLFEGLVVRPASSGAPLQPGVAERWEVSEDGRTYTFHLRDDARWTSGRAVTAHDFVYSWRRKLAPDTGSTSVEPLYWIEGARAFNEGKTQDPETVGVRAADDRTLVVTLDSPTPFWLEYVAAAYYLPVPKEAIEAHGKRWTRPEHIISNGAFRLGEWQPRARLVLDKSPTYWDADSVSLPGVILYVSESQTQSLTRYDTGVIHWARSALTGADLHQAIRSGRPDLFIDPYLCYYAYLFNTKSPPYDDPRVRRAINMAIDKRRLVEHVIGGKQVPADGPVMPYFEETMGYPKPRGDRHDPAAARALLAEAGYPGGEGFPPLKLVYNTSEGHKAIAEFLQRDLAEELGVEVSAVNVEWKSLLKQLRAGDFQMARFGMCGIEHPYDLMNLFLSYHPENSMGYANAEVDRLLERARRTQDLPRQMALIAKAEALLQADMPMAPLYYYTKTYLKKPVLQGLEPELTNTHLFKYMRWATPYGGEK